LRRDAVLRIGVARCGAGPDIPGGSTQYGGPAQCFDAQSAESNMRKEQKAAADIPVNYQSWLTEDVAYIIAPEERCAFLQLSSDEERDHFIEQFWYRRASDPESLENDFQMEHCRRIVFANNRFGTDIPGWQTDRGHIYIRYGPPDMLVSHPAGEPMWGPPKDAPDSVEYSWERWHYTYLEGVGENVVFEFVDPAGSEEYQLRIGPQDKNTFIFKPFNAVSHGDPASASSEKVQLNVYIGAERPPLPQYKNLEAMAVSKILCDQVCSGHRIRFARATHASIMATIVVDLPEDQSSAATKDNKSEDGYEIFGRITRPSEWEFQHLSVAPMRRSIARKIRIEKLQFL
jgi:GWxTD domain-containing protein